MRLLPIFLVVMLAIPAVLGASFTFDPDPLGSIFNISEKTTFLWDLNVSVTESLVKYSRETTNLSNLNIHNESGMINYTPPASDVGYHAGGVIFISENRTSSLDFITTKIYFNVTNVNDAPNITAYAPSTTQVTLNESSNLLFNITATDEDLVLGDTINISFLIDGGIVQTNLSNLTINVTYNFSSGFCNASTFNVTGKVTDLAGLSVQQVWNLTINNSNRPPQLNGSILNITISEDSNFLNNLTLYNYFYDLDNQQCGGTNQDNLTFTTNLTYGVNVFVNISIDSNSSNASFYPDANFVGNISFVFIANDSTATASSNVLILNVTNVADPPVLVNLTNQTATVNVTFTYIMNVTDPDLIYGDSITWGTNSTIFTITKINSTHGMINFTPTISDVNNYSIMIMVNDTYNLSDNHTFFFRVQNNTAPVLFTIGNRNATQGVLFNLSISGYDTDNDNITFSSNSTLFNITFHNGSMGNISFTPTNDQVGNYSIRFIATDVNGATASETIVFGINNTNDAPTINSITSPQFVKVNTTLLLNITGADVDIQWGDNLSFGDNTTLFQINTTNSTLALINYTPIAADVGNYSISINITDNSGAYASFTFILAVTNSSPPSLTQIGDYTVAENSFLNITMNASDADGDALTFSINDTNLTTTNFTFTYNSTVRIAYFTGTPDQIDVGNHSFVVNVTDVNNNIATQIFWIFVTLVDDTPILQLIQNQTAYENTQFLLNVTAYDEEIIQFGTALNLSFFSNVSFFNFTTRNNATSMVVNFTPTTAQVGNYSINITVSDNVSNTSQVIFLQVLNINDPPRILNFSPSNLTPRINENTSQQFTVNATDLDWPFNETLSIAWYLDGNNQTGSISTYFNGTNLTSNFTWGPSFCESGIHNLTAVVSDLNLSTNRTYWNITVVNVNRLPEYGIKRQTNIYDFTNGTRTNTSVTNSSGNVTLFQLNSTSYADFGSFTSQTFDFGAKYAFSSEMNITNLDRMEWDVEQPLNTSFLLQFRTSLDGTTFTNWSANYSTNFSFEYQTVRYVQYRGFFFANTSLTGSPNLKEVRILYTMKNITINQNTRYTNIIDLADYYYDADASECNGTNRDNLTRSVVGNDSILMRFSGSVITLLEHTTFEGQDAVQWLGNDTINRTLSPEILFTVVPTAGGSISSSTTSSSGGGGSGGASSTTIQTITKPKNVTQPIALNIIVPKPIVIYQNESISVPIELVNNENFSLADIHLFAEVPNSSIKPVFTIDYIQELGKDQKINTTLVIHSFKSLGTYEVIVNANVSDPPYLGKATFFISSIELGSANESQFNTRITFARDLLTENPECLELTENIEKAQEFMKAGDYNSADQLLTQIVEDCRLLISTKDQYLETPGQQFTFEKFMRIMRRPYVMGITIIVVLGILSFVFYRMMNRSPLPKRKLSPEEEEIAAILGIKRK